MGAEVLAVDAYGSNAALVTACVRLGYLQSDWRTLDATYGRGIFWQRWKPDSLVTNDWRPELGADHHCDFRSLPWPDAHFDAVVFDPPYKLNGTPTRSVDERYGVHEPTRWQDRHRMILAGIAECARVAGQVLLVKCQDQVVSGRVRWQTRLFADEMECHGFGLEDALHMVGGRPQPEGRRQVHARRNYSTLLVGVRRKG